MISLQQSKATSSWAVRLVVLSWLAVAILHEIPIGGHWLPIGFQTWLLLASWPTLFVGAYFLALAIARPKVLPPPPPSFTSSYNLAIAILMVVSALGALLVVFDFAYLRGYGFNLNVNDIRTIEGNAAIQGISESSPISGAGRLMLPAAIPAIILAAKELNTLTRANKLLMAAALAVILYEQIAFEGGRLFIAALVACGLISYVLVGRHKGSPDKVETRRLPLVRLAIMGVVVLYFFLTVFLSRVASRDDLLWAAYARFVGDFQIFVDTSVIARFEGAMGPFWFGISMLWLYITQGINELDYLLLYENIPSSGGLYQFPQISPIARILFGQELSFDFYNILPNVGTYLTIYGANYLDFGHRGAIISAVICGSATGWSVRRFAEGAMTGIALCGPIMLSVALFSPIISLVTNVWPALLWTFATGGLLSTIGAGRKLLPGAREFPQGGIVR